MVAHSPYKSESRKAKLSIANLANLGACDFLNVNRCSSAFCSLKKGQIFQTIPKIIFDKKLPSCMKFLDSVQRRLKRLVRTADSRSNLSAQDLG